MVAFRSELAAELKRRGLKTELEMLASWDFDHVLFWCQTLELCEFGFPVRDQQHRCQCGALPFVRGPVLSDRYVAGCPHCPEVFWLVRLRTQV